MCIDANRPRKSSVDHAPYNPRDAPAHLRAADEAAIQTQNALNVARDTLLAAQREFHAIILGVKDEVKVLYGPDSDEVAALGLKKKSERSRPKRASKPPATE